MHPFFGKAAAPSAPIFGAPEGFQFDSWLRNSNCVRVALAFGHMSGWRKIEPAIKSTKAHKVDILLGQAFFQTEPALLFELKKLQANMPGLTVKLASAVSTFHPKVWIVNQVDTSEAIVGSSNLSNGGFAANVECNLYTGAQGTVEELSRWFEYQWSIGHDLSSSFFISYVDEYNKINDQRNFLKAKVSTSESALASAEAKWRKKEALSKAVAYWKSDTGAEEVRERDVAIRTMREILRFPNFDFAAADYEEFVRVPELGKIRLAYVQKTIAALPQLKTALEGIRKETVAVSYSALDRVYGIGPNLTTKLFAVFDPETFIVVNGPVERALLSFGFSQEDLDPMTGLKYEHFLKELQPFIVEAQIQKLSPAAALDGFFFYYRGVP